MGSPQALAEFAAQYDLYDRIVLSLSLTGDGAVLVLDLAHCDDPARSDTARASILALHFACGTVELTEDPMPEPASMIGGTVLEYAIEAGRLVIGIEWSLRAFPEYRWTRLLVSAPPCKIYEDPRVL